MLSRRYPHRCPQLAFAALLGAAVACAVASAPGSPFGATSPAAPAPEAPVANAPAAAVEEAAAPAALPGWTNPFPSDTAIDDGARDAIAHEARGLGASLPAGTTLRAQLFSSLVRAPRCGRAHSAAVAGVFAEASPSEIVEALEQLHSACDEVVVEAAGFANAANTRLADHVLGLAERSADDAVRRAAWLSYGSLGETAARAGDATLARHISSRVARELHGAAAGRRTLLVKAAGNAACAPCLPELALDLRSDDTARRASAVAAHRFVDHGPSVATMCGALAKDTDDAVRDMAAWSLEWRGGEPTARATCLEEAARVDPSRRVRMQSVLALAVLSDASGDARRALARLADDPALDMRPFAERALEVRRGAPAPLLAAAED